MTRTGIALFAMLGFVTLAHGQDEFSAVGTVNVMGRVLLGANKPPPAPFTVRIEKAAPYGSRRFAYRLRAVTEPFVIEEKTDPDGSWSAEIPAGSYQYTLIVIDEAGRPCTGYCNSAFRKNYGDMIVDGSSRLKGRIASATSSPLAGVVYRLEKRFLGRGRHWMTIEEGKTGKDGRFVVEGLVKGAYRCVINDPAWTKTESLVSITGPDAQIQLTASRAAALRGRLVDDAGAPVPGLTLKCFGKGSPVETMSGKDGSFAFLGLKAGTHRLALRADGWALKGKNSSSFDLSEGERREITLEVALTGSLALLFQGDGRLPLRSVQIRLRQKDRAVEAGKGPRRRRPIGRGIWRQARIYQRRAKFSRLPRGRYDVEVSSSSCTLAKAVATIEQGGVTNLKVSLPELYTVTGQVLREDGRPLRMARISGELKLASGKDGDEEGSGSSTRFVSASSDRRGSFRLEGLLPGALKLRIRHEGSTPQEDSFVLGTERLLRRTYRLGHGTQVKGIVFDAEGRPLAKAPIELRMLRKTGKGRYRRRYDRTKRTKTTKDGRFSLRGVTAGQAMIDVTPKDAVPLNKSVVVPPKGSLSVELRLSRGKEITGKVQEADGTPARGWKLSLYGKSTKVRKIAIRKTTILDETGRFAVKGLPDGPYRLSFRAVHESYSYDLPDVSAGADDVLVVLAPKIPLVLHVEDPAGKPCREAKVAVVAGSRWGGASGRKRLVDENGRLRSELRTGRYYHVTAAAPSYLPARKRIKIAAGKVEAEVVTLRLEKGVTLSGIVVNDKTGKPASKVWVRVTGRKRSRNAGFYRGSGVPSCKTDENGRFHFDEQRAGALRLVVSKDRRGRNRMASKGLVLKSGQPLEDVRIEVEEPGKLHGKIVHGGGKSVSGRAVTLRALDEPSRRYRTTSDGKGTFRFRAVMPGAYRVSLTAKSFGPRFGGFDQASKTVTIHPGETAAMTFSVGRPRGQTLTGVVTLEGKALSAGRIMLCPDGAERGSIGVLALLGRSLRGKLGKDGSFRLQDVSPGQYVFRLDRGVVAEAKERVAFCVRVKVAKAQKRLEVAVRGKTLEGELLGPDGSPVAKARVTAVPSGGSLSARQLMGLGALTDDKGAFRIAHISCDRVDLRIRHRRLGQAARAGIALAGPVTKTSVALRKTVTFSGTVKVPAGEDESKSAGLLVVLLTTDGRAVGVAATTPGGAFVIRNKVESGRYRAFVVSEDFSIEALELTLEKDYAHAFEVVLGGDVDVQLAGSPSLRSKRIVRLRNAAGKVVPRLRQAVIGGFRSWSRALGRPSDDRGRTRICGLRPGTYTVAVDGAKATATVKVRAMGVARVTLPLDR